MGSDANAWSSRLSGNELNQLLAWYASQGRKLPWRETYDPYRIWIIETLLQQTRISQAQERIERFLERFPTLESLARSSIDAILELWQGLGYYQRAHNLHKSAQKIARAGGFAAYASREALESLPGIGPYTARAIWSFSRQGESLPVDGNIVRVLSRYFGDPTPAVQRTYYQAQADALPSPWQQREVAFALMDLAQLLCTPQRPRCLLCPLQRGCEALASGTPESFPPSPARKPKPIRHFILLWFADRNAIWLEKRSPNGLWGGLWCLPLHEVQEPPPRTPSFLHTFTHFQMVAYIEALPEPAPNTEPILWEKLPAYGLPAPIRRLLAHEAKTYGASPSL